MSNYFTQHSQYKTHNDTATATKTKQINSPKTTSTGTYQVIQKAGQSGTNLTSPQTATTTFKNVQNTIAATAATTYPAKMNSHLLDHGYGATLQPSFTLDPPKKDNDFRITNYYKASWLSVFVQIISSNSKMKSQASLKALCPWPCFFFLQWSNVSPRFNFRRWNVVAWHRLRLPHHRNKSNKKLLSNKVQSKIKDIQKEQGITYSHTHSLVVPML